MIGGRIYYTIGNIIRSSTFEGNSTEEIQGYGHQYSWYKVTAIDVHGDFLYYTDNWNHGDVFKTNKSGGNHVDAAHVYSNAGDVRTYNGKGNYEFKVEKRFTLCFYFYETYKLFVIRTMHVVRKMR